MKTNTILSFLFLFLATNAQAQLKPIDFPRFSSKSSSSIEITRIEQNDTATILFMEAYNQPNYWVRISSATTLQGTSTGKTYKLLSSKGFQLDQQINMPASGNVPFQLFFEPLDSKEQKISFIEGQQEGDYIVKDIELNEDYKKAPIHCHISGTVINKPLLSRLMLCTDLAKLGTSSWISIPVHNGTFNYDLYTDIEEKYRLIYWDDYLKHGIIIPAPFFAENGNIEMTLYPYLGGRPDTYDIKTTAPLTSEMLAYTKKENALFQFKDIDAAIEALEKADGYYTEAYKSFWKKFDETKVMEERNKLFKERDRLEETGAFYTDAAKALRNRLDARHDSLAAWRLEYFAQHPSLPSLYLLQESIEFAKYEKKEITPYSDLYHNVFEQKFATHPIGKHIQQYLASLSIKVGNQFVDFIAPDLEGNNIKLSDVIKNKVALIDLWASYCGPCRRSSSSMIPIYKKYENKGFTIIGIAREKDNANAMKAAIKKDGYPWMNLIELNDKAQIWSKYGIPNAAGSTFLVDNTGRILAINPSAEEVETILEQTL